MYRPEPIPLPAKVRIAGRHALHAFKVIAYNILMTAALLLLIEIAVRIFYPEITPMGTDSNLMRPHVYQNSSALRPNAAGLSCGAEFRVNPFGFWKYSAAFDSAKPSWLLLGDSVTMGMGVEPDSTFAGRLAAAVDSFNILNAAWIGYSSTDYRHVLEGLLDRKSAKGRSFLNIKRITLFWCLNDVYAGLAGEPGQTVRQISGGLLRFLKLHYFTYQWLKALLFDRSRDYYLHDRNFYETSGAHLPAAFKDLQQMRALVSKNNLRFEIVLLPYEYQLRQTNDDFLPQEVMQTALQNLNITVRDATEYLRSQEGPPAMLYCFGDGIHFSPRGHAVLAEFLRRQLGWNERP
jgi:lysophospholipase L1-like esterase